MAEGQRLKGILRAQRCFAFGVIVCTCAPCWANETMPSSLVSLSNVMGHMTTPQVHPMRRARAAGASVGLIAHRPKGRTREILKFVLRSVGGRRF